MERPLDLRPVPPGEPVSSLDELARDPASRSERRRLDASVETLGGKGSRLVWLVRHGFTLQDADPDITDPRLTWPLQVLSLIHI